MMVGVIGGRSCSEDIAELSFSIGVAIADEGHHLVCGGLGGVMHHACRGAKSRGGTTIGILPMSDRAAANPYVDIVIPTGIGLARNVIIVLSADFLVAVDGGYGTLSEISYALQFGKKVFGFRTSWGSLGQVVTLSDVSELRAVMQDLAS